mmetsp:Transcript_19848/g.32625  ORF Transcript_19848/g.32625 Transcript_19848/m.32625 type:complete len:328 (-) Transcript_19848:25-1008(-)
MSPGWVFSAFATGAFAGASVTYSVMRVWKARKDVPGTHPTDAHGTDAHGTVPGGIRRYQSSVFGHPVSSYAVKHFDGFSLGYDRRLRLSTWAYEKVTKETVKGEAERSNKFFPDKSEDSIFQSRLDDYKNTGLDRGHLVPAADFKNSKRAMDETFILSNICPQSPDLNRTYWAQLEMFVRELTNHFDEVHTITGPLFVPKFDREDKEWKTEYKMVGNSRAVPGNFPQLPVPTHFYKIVLGRRLRERNKLFMAAFVLPNEPVKSGTSLKEFQVTVPFVEYLSGHLFFPKLLHHDDKSSHTQEDLCDEVTCSVVKNQYAKTRKNKVKID